MPTPTQRQPAHGASQLNTGQPCHQERVKGGLAAGTRAMITGWKYLEGVHSKKGEG